MAQSLPSSSIRSAIIRELGEGAVDLSGDIERYRKLVLREIARFHQWSWLDNVPLSLTTESGENYVTIPSYVNRIRNVYQSGGAEEMTYAPDQEYARLAALNSGAQDNPSRWNIQDGRIYFWPPLTTGESVTVFADISGEQLEDNDEAGISGVGTVIPQSYAFILEAGILSYLDSIDNKMKWMSMTHQKLLEAKAGDVKNKAHRVKGTLDKNIDGMRYYYNS